MTEEDEEFERIMRRQAEYLLNPRWEDKKWKGLTDEEIHEIAWPLGGETVQAIIKHAILQAEKLLKDKNDT
jgi:hypothetical protein